MALWNRKAAEDGSGKPPRRMQRHAPRAAVKTSLGKVLDLSGGGARLRCDAKPAVTPQAATPLTIHLMSGPEMVNARVCWVRKCGLLKAHWEIGLKFIAVPAAQASRLSSIAVNGFAPPEDKPKKIPAPPPAGGQAVAKRGVDAAMGALRVHFEELGLPAEATFEEVRAAHRKLVRSCHPDVAPGPDAEARFLRLQESYQLLVDAFRDREERLAAAA